MSAVDPVAATARIAERYPPPDRGTLVFWGSIARMPFAGMTWQLLEYLQGARSLGWDVWYVEDSDRSVYNPTTFLHSGDPEPNIEYLARWMEVAGFADRWVFRVPRQKEGFVGAADADGIRSLYARADAVINVYGAQELLPRHDSIRRLVYLQTDPVAKQVEIATGDAEATREIGAYDHLFTYATNIAGEDCLIPNDGYVWHPTRPPVCLDRWATGTAPPGEDASFSTVATWSHRGKDVVWKDQRWRWTKHVEFLKFIDLPQRTRARFQLAVRGIGEEDKQRLRDHGWRVTGARDVNDLVGYHRFLCSSLGEFTVAKEQYTAPRTGWIGERTVAYLAAGRPAIVQDTGFKQPFDTGEGLLAFRTLEEAEAAVADVLARYTEHADAARQLAADHFEAGRVVDDMLRTIGIS